MKKNNRLLIIGGTSSLAHDLIYFGQKENYEIFASVRDQESFPVSKEVNLFTLDISNLASIEAFLAKINNFGFSHVVCLIGALSEISHIYLYEDSKRYIETYVTNLVYVIDSLLHQNRLQKNCRILIMSSRAAKYGSFDYYYSISKAAIEAYVKSKSKSSPQIRINSVSTGLVKGSRMFIQIPDEVAESHHERSSNKLLSVTEVVNELINFLKNNELKSGCTLYIGPQYE